MRSDRINKLYLFYPNSLIGFIISLVTRSPFAHAAIEYCGVLYDASETRGNFARSTIDLSQRAHLCLEFPGDLSTWVLEMTMPPKKYDWIGVLGWLFSANDRSKFHCFEAAWSALHAVGIATPINRSPRLHQRRDDPPGHLSGSDLLTMMVSYGQQVQQDLERASALVVLDHHVPALRAKMALCIQGPVGLTAARSINALAMMHTATDSVIEACVAMYRRKEMLIRFEEELYALSDAGLCQARASP